MPLDYSKFDAIGDSDEDNAPQNLGDRLRDLLPGGGDDSPSPTRKDEESPRENLRRALEGKREGGVVSSHPTTDQEDGPSSLERFAELAEGAEGTHHDDSLELVAASRAVVESAAAAGDGEAAKRLVQALTSGLQQIPPVAFAREQAPEMLGEVLVAMGFDLVEPQSCDTLFDLVLQRCKAREVYTFLLGVLCSYELRWIAVVRGIRLLKSALLAIPCSKRHLFLGSCLSALLRQYTTKSSSSDPLLAKLEVLREFVMDLVIPYMKSEEAEANETRVSRSMLATFLFKLVHWGYSKLIVEELDLIPLNRDSALPQPLLSSQQFTKSRSLRRVVIRCGGPEGLLQALVGLARDAAAASPKSVVSLLESMDLGAPTGDGGGDLEISPLCLSTWVCLAEIHGVSGEMVPYNLPLGLSPVRRTNLLLKCVYVLAANRVDAVEVSIADDESNSAPCGSKWSHHGFALLSQSAVPLLQVALVQTPEAFHSQGSALCRWQPLRTISALLEALSSAPDIPREVRGVLFNTVASSIRVFDWPCRFELYLQIINGTHVDSAVGAVVTLAKEDWWDRVTTIAGDGGSLDEERSRLIRLLGSTLSGDLQIVDGMDTLTAALNVCRLITLSRTVAGAFMRTGLRQGGPGIDLEKLLLNVSAQIDFELSLLSAPQNSSSGIDELTAQIQQAMEGSSGRNPAEVSAMKRDRIEMVAHLVARVRELLAANQE